MGRRRPGRVSGVHPDGAGRSGLLTLLCLLLVTPTRPAGAQLPLPIPTSPPPGFDRTSGQRAAQTHLGNLIGLDTSNPPGNEVVAALYLSAVFAAIPGVETEVVEVGEGRANFTARLLALEATERPVLIMGHMDVVGADTASWQSDPFVATIRDGYLYGRGAIDDKGPLAAAVAAMQQLAAQRGRLRRDVIFLATAAEEGGDVGIDWIVEHRPDLLGDAEFAVNEGGRIRIWDGRIRTVNIQTTEKVSYDVVVSARGPSGHGSVPLPDNALAALARAVARVHDWRPPVYVNETTRLYFTRLAEIEEDPATREAMRQVASSSNERVIRAAADRLSRSPLHNAVLRTGASLTLIDGGLRSNVIPSEGTATFNVRILPGEDIREVVREMSLVAAEPQVTFELMGQPRVAPPPSSVTTRLFRAMERAAETMAPDALIVPFMSTGATDGATLRAVGIPTYGILPFPLAAEDELRMHGDNERVAVEALGWGAEYLYRVLFDVTTR